MVSRSSIRRVDADFESLIKEIQIRAMQMGKNRPTVPQITKKISKIIKEDRLLYDQIIKI